MYISHALINALNAHMIHINLNMIFYTHILYIDILYSHNSGRTLKVLLHYIWTWSPFLILGSGGG